MARDQGYVTDDVNPNLINSGVTPSQADIAASAAVANGPSGPVNINGKMLTPIYGTKTVDYGGRRGGLEVPDYSNPISYEEYLPNHMVNSYDASGKLTNTYSNAQGGFLTNLGNALQPLAPLLAAAGIDFLSGGAASGALASIFGGTTDAAAALGTGGTTSAMAGGFGDTAAGALSTPVIPAAATLTGDLAPLASAAPAVTPLSEIGAAAPAAATVGTPLTEIGAAAPTVADATTSLSQIANTAPAALTAGSAPGSALAATTGAAGSASAADLLAAGVGASGQLPMALGNQAVASGMAPGSLGAQAASEGSLLPTESSAAYGTSGLGSLTGADAATAALGSSANQAVASGMAPGEVGAAQSAAGQLTADQLASASGALPANMTGNLPMSTTDPSLLQQLQTATGLTGTQLSSLLQGGIGAINSNNISNAIGAGVNAQAAANAQSQGVLKDVYNTNLGFQQPYQAAGTGAVNQLAASQPYLTHQFDATDLQKGLAPNYDFMLQQGQMANQRAANVGGGALSGNTLQGLQNYTQNYAGNAYQNAFNNYQTQRNNIYNSLSGIANIGQTANAGATTAGQNYGTGTVGLNTGLAGVQAAGLLGQAQAGASGATGVGNSILLSSLLGQNPSAATTTPTGQLGNVSGIVNSGTNIYNQISKLFGG